jgi:hypothetical protein
VPRKLFRKYLAQREILLAKPWLAPFRRWLSHPNLWHLNRRSVAGAAARHRLVDSGGRWAGKRRDGR